MEQIDYIKMACRTGKPVVLRGGQKAYVVADADDYKDKLDRQVTPMCNYVGFTTSDVVGSVMSIMSWDKHGNYLASLVDNPNDIVGLWEDDDEDAPNAAEAASLGSVGNGLDIIEIHKDFGEHESGLGASIDKLVEETLALKNTMLKHRIRHVEAETRCKVIAVTEVINNRDDCYTYKFLLSNDAVKTVAIPKTTLSGGVWVR